MEGPRRFSDLQKDIGIARRMLTINLHAPAPLTRWTGLFPVLMRIRTISAD
ncbi:hypothetical protein ACO0LM_22330 [Undibacterium sp. Di26W]|uniref:hypothetical protein n=1 Tax=Undibacterium sp. Di26W TaxID=3413035 RepID=UPI003BF45968